MAVDLLENPDMTPLGKRRQLKKISTMSDEELKKLDPKDIKAALINGADLDNAGNPKQKDSSLKIRIELDLEVEVHLTARVQGDVTIGLL